MQFVGGNTPLNNDLRTDSRPDLNLQNLMNTSTGSSGETTAAFVRGNVGRGLQNTATLLGFTRFFKLIMRRHRIFFKNNKLIERRYSNVFFDSLKFFFKIVNFVFAYLGL